MVKRQRQIGFFLEGGGVQASPPGSHRKGSEMQRLIWWHKVTCPECMGFGYIEGQRTCPTCQGEKVVTPQPPMRELVSDYDEVLRNAGSLGVIEL